VSGLAHLPASFDVGGHLQITPVMAVPTTTANRLPGGWPLRPPAVRIPASTDQNRPFGQGGTQGRQQTSQAGQAQQAAVLPA